MVPTFYRRSDAPRPLLEELSILVLAAGHRLSDEVERWANELRVFVPP